CRPVGRGGGRRAGAVPGHGLSRMGLRPRLAGGGPGRQLRKNVRRIRRAARMIGNGPNEEQAMPAESRPLKELFLAALNVAPEGPAAWLERECGPDAALRRRVELLLAAHDTPQSLLDRLAPVAEPRQAATGAFAAGGGDPPPGREGEG